MAIKGTMKTDSLLKAFFALLVETGELRETLPDLETKLSDDGLTVEKTLKALWNCPDPVPAKIFKAINRYGLTFQKRTYAAAVQTFYHCIRGGAWTLNQKSCFNCQRKVCPAHKIIMDAVDRFQPGFFDASTAFSIRSDFTQTMGGRCHFYIAAEEPENSK